MIKTALCILSALLLLACNKKVDPAMHYYQFDVLQVNDAKDSSISYHMKGLGIMVKKYPETEMEDVTAGDFEARLKLLETEAQVEAHDKIKDQAHKINEELANRYFAVVNLEGDMTAAEDSFRDIITSLTDNGVFTLKPGHENALGSWPTKEGATARILLAPYEITETKPQNMLIAAEGFTAEKGDAPGTLKIILNHGKVQSLSYNQKFKLSAVSEEAFDDLWQGFIKDKKPNGFLSFHDGQGKTRTWSLEFTQSTMKAGTITLMAKILTPAGVEADDVAQKELADLQGLEARATNAVVFVDSVS